MKYNAKFTKIEDGYYRAKINNVELWEVDELLVWTIKEREKEIERLNNIINELKKENQELKKKYENAVADYEKTRFEKEQLNSLVNSCQEEIRQLKKQLEENKHKGLYNTCLPYSTGYNKAIKDKENQQKEFIEYLEKRYKDITDVIGSYGSNTDILYGKKDMIREILQKYKELKGSDK